LGKSRSARHGGLPPHLKYDSPSAVKDHTGRLVLEASRGTHAMFNSTLTRRLFLAAEVLLLVGTVAAAASLLSPDEWNPLLLVVLLLLLAFFGEWFTVETSDGMLSASLVAIVLAMSLLGPAPAAACGIAAMIHRSAMRHLPATQWLNNLSTFAAFPFAGGLMVRALTGNVHDPHNHQMTQSVVFGLIVFGAFIAALGLNLILVGLDVYTEEGRSFARQARDFLPLLPGELAAGALATILALAYTNLGLPALFGSVALLLIFQRLTVALLRSEDRAEQLEARSRQLVGLQLGVLRTLVRALKMRDPTTGHHASAVAHYCEALAQEIGCAEDVQDVVRTAALLHDVGKFTWPDRVLHADIVKDEDRAIVESHAQEGAILVGALDGYGPAADAILYHHERVDGRGYPAGLIGNEIPLASRVLAICCTYDTMTARESYRSPMTPEEAMVELRNGAAHGQFDPDLVESFIAMLTRIDPITSTENAQHADFETELEFDRRVRDMAKPRSTGATPRQGQPIHPDAGHHHWRSSILGLRQRVLNKE
jgi:putative nucleotidyltransferase with HDIG domain